MAQNKQVYMFNKILSWLKSPYPLLYGDKKNYLQIIITALFISTLIYVIQPFGLAGLSNQALIFFVTKVTSSAILISIVVTQLLPKYLFNEDLWQVWKEAALILLNLSVIAFVLQYLVLENIEAFKLVSYFSITILIASGPIFIRLLLTQNQLLKTNLTQAQLVNNELKTHHNQNTENEITLTANDGELLQFSGQKFIYAKAEKNYVEIFCQENSAITATVLRMSFSTLLEQFSNSTLSMIHCHRSYLVNQQRISKVVGDSRGYSLELDKGIYLIPVSRAKAKQVLIDVKR